jgi:hypothetical protein
MIRRLIAALLSVFLWVEICLPAPIQITGFETGNDDSTSRDIRSYSGTFDVQTSVKRSGAYALRTNPTTTGTGNARIGSINANGSPSVTVELSQATIYSRWYFRAATLPASSEEEIATVIDTSGAAKAQLRITSAGKLKICDRAASCTAAGTATISTGTWYRIEWRTETGASVASEVKVDGTSDITTTATNYGATTHGSLRLGKVNDRNGQSVDFYYDDVSIDPSAYPGAGEGVAMAIDSDGSTANWTTGTGATYAEVDEIPNDGETTYLKTSAANTHLVGFVSSATAGITGTINAIKPWTICRDESVVSSMALRLRMNATNTDNTAADPGASYVPRFKIVTVDPSDSGAITTGDLDGVEAGIVTTTAVAQRCTSFGMYVDFTASAPTPTPTPSAVKRLAIQGVG